MSLKEPFGCKTLLHCTENTYPVLCFKTDQRARGIFLVFWHTKVTSA